MTMAGDDRGGAEARRSMHRPQQDAGRPAVQRVPRPSSPTTRSSTSSPTTTTTSPRPTSRRSDLYIEKDSAINQEIDRLRHAATAAAVRAPRRDHRRLACRAIFGLGSPQTYNDNLQVLRKGDYVDRDELLRKLVSIQYNAQRPRRWAAARFRVRGETLEIFPAYAETAFRATLFGDEVERLQHFDPLTGELIEDDLEHVAIWPATHYNVKEGTIESARWPRSARELNQRCTSSEAEGKLLEAHRLRQRTQYDMEMLREVGLLLRHRELLAHPRRPQRPAPGPYCLIDYFPTDFVCFIDESHQTVPQIGGMYEGDRSRKSDARRLRLPAAERDGQPPADVRRVPLDHAADGVRVGDAGRLRALRTQHASSSRSCARRGSSTPTSRCARRATRSTT